MTVLKTGRKCAYPPAAPNSRGSDKLGCCDTQRVFNQRLMGGEFGRRRRTSPAPNPPWKARQSTRRSSNAAPWPRSAYPFAMPNALSTSTAARIRRRQHDNSRECIPWSLPTDALANARRRFPIGHDPLELFLARPRDRIKGSRKPCPERHSGSLFACFADARPRARCSILNKQTRESSCVCLHGLLEDSGTHHVGQATSKTASISRAGPVT
jgi:hypothetical protein